MSLAATLLEGYNGYSSKETIINDPVGYMNEACIECITGLYEASQQFYTGDIIGQTQVLMEGTDPKQKIKELWEGFKKKVVTVLGKFIEKLKKVTGIFRKRSSDGSQKLDNLKKDISNSKDEIMHAERETGDDHKSETKKLTIPKTLASTWNYSVDKIRNPINKWFERNEWGIDDARDLEDVINNPGDFRRIDRKASGVVQGLTVRQIEDAFERDFKFPMSDISRKYEELYIGLSQGDPEEIDVPRLTKIIDILSGNQRTNERIVSNLSTSVKKWENVKKLFDTNKLEKDMLSNSDKLNEYARSINMQPQAFVNEVVNRISAMISVSILLTNHHINLINNDIRFTEKVSSICTSAWNSYKENWA